MCRGWCDDGNRHFNVMVSRRRGGRRRHGRRSGRGGRDDDSRGRRRRASRRHRGRGRDGGRGRGRRSGNRRIGSHHHQSSGRSRCGWRGSHRRDGRSGGRTRGCCVRDVRLHIRAVATRGSPRIVCDQAVPIVPGVPRPGGVTRAASIQPGEDRLDVPIAVSGRGPVSKFGRHQRRLGRRWSVLRCRRLGDTRRVTIRTVRQEPGVAVRMDHPCQRPLSLIPIPCRVDGHVARRRTGAVPLTQRCALWARSWPHAWATRWSRADHGFRR